MNENFMPIPSVKKQIEEQNNTQNSEKKSRTDLVNALKSNFATTANRITINSTGEEVTLREVSVLEQKTFSRIMLDNENKRDVVYDAQCALINQVCLTEGFDVYNVTEFDRLKLFVAIYQSNLFKQDIEFTCPECNTPNKYKLDFQDVFDKLDKIDISPKEFEYENKSFKMKFTVQYPKVSTVSRFHKLSSKKFKNLNQKETETMENLNNVDFISLFIKKIEILNKINGNIVHVNMDDYDVSDIEPIISEFPQDVLYTEDGVLKYIAKNIIGETNKVFTTRKCAQCGAEHETGVNSSESFF